MAYPGENEHVEYLQYIERVAMGDERGPRLSKEEWRKKKKGRDKNEIGAVKVNALEADDE